MRRYIWTRRVGVAGLGLIVLWVVFVAVVRVVNVPLGGIQPEAFALIAMMTALPSRWARCCWSPGGWRRWSGG